MVEAVKAGRDNIEILDQRRLPASVEFLTCRNAADVIMAIQTLAVRGAPAIGIAGLYALWLEALTLQGGPDFWRNLEAGKERIKHARPTAVNLAWAVDRVWRSLSPQWVDDAVVQHLKRAADALVVEEESRSARMAAFGASLLEKGYRVLTHCNTGSLATAGVGTALGVIREGHRTGRLEMVWVDETRPLLQGARLTAWELMQDGIPATLITDNMAATLMAQGQVDAVIVGADRICANGDTANKIGTYGLAVLARHHRVPFYVAAPLSTVDLTLPDGSDIPIEQRAADEVRAFHGALAAPRGMPVYNPAFDVTPGPLIEAIITDRGVAREPYAASLRTLFEQEDRELRDGHVGH